MDRKTHDVNVADTNARLSEVIKARLPDAEVKMVQRLRPDASFVETQFMLAMNRWHNRICDRYKECPKFGTQAVYLNLSLCQRCYCTWYCSEECRSKAAESHAKWCCNKDADPDQGPLKVHLIKAATK